MRLSAEYRHEAASKTKPFAGTLAIICLIYTVITAIINISYKETRYIGDYSYETTVTPMAFLLYFVGGQFSLSWIFISEKVNLNQKPEIKDLFYGFDDYKRGFFAYLIMDIYLILWGIITLGIAAIVKYYSYSMTYYLLEKDKDLSPNEAITLSRKLMKGRKWKLFCLQFSYIGWYLLSILTLGILTLWVTPRVHQAQYLFYKDVCEENGYYVNEVNVVDVVSEVKEDVVEEQNSELNNSSSE